MYVLKCAMSVSLRDVSWNNCVSLQSLDQRHGQSYDHFKLQVYDVGKFKIIMPHFQYFYISSG